MSNFLKSLSCINGSKDGLSKKKYEKIIKKLSLNYKSLRLLYSDIMNKFQGKNEDKLSFEDFKNIYPDLQTDEKYHDENVLERIFNGIVYLHKLFYFLFFSKFFFQSI